MNRAGRNARPTHRPGKNVTLTVYEGGGHGLAAMQQDRFNADLLALARS